MLYILIAALVVVNVCYLIHLERKDKRFDEAIGRLLVHVQAPEVAVAERVRENSPDEDSYPLTERESVETQEERRLALERMERIENEGLFS